MWFLFRFFSPNKVFGRSRHLDVGVLILLTGASCIVCGEIVHYLLLHLWEGSSFVELSLALLGFCGFSQNRLQISFLVGGIGWGSIHLTFGI